MSGDNRVSPCLFNAFIEPLCYRFAILGGGNVVPIGTFSEYVTIERDQVLKSPEHLDDEHVAAWPLGAVTAWRYAFHCPVSDDGWSC